MHASIPLLATTLALALGTATAAPGDWLVASGTGSCSVSMVDFPDSPRGFAAGSFNCGLVTEDGGLTWSAVDVMPSQGQSMTWAHALSADELFAGRLGLYRSTDRGANWSQVGPWDNNANGSIFDLSFLPNGRMVAIKGGQIWTSDDHGANWELRYPGEFNINFDELHFPTATTGYATGGVVRGGNGLGTVLRTDDGGDTWTLLAAPPGAITAASFVDVEHGMAAMQDQYVYTVWTTSDGAATWQQLPSAPAGYVTDLRQRNGEHWYAATTDGCVFTSRDGGNDWQEGYCDGDFRALASISLRGGAAVVAGNDGLVLYEDRILRSGFEGE